jgi:exopolyphosphatase/guanosine-5'-triphosphate,3'-diphosphate pyrophosphatase
MDQMPVGDPPGDEALARCRQWLEEYVRREIKPRFVGRRDPGSPDEWVGTGGATTIMARMRWGLEDFQRERIDGTRLRLREVVHEVERLWGATLSERRRRRGLPDDRADVILMGSAIYESLMKGLGADSLRVSTRGLRFGALIGAWKDRGNP